MRNHSISALLCRLEQSQFYHRLNPHIPYLVAMVGICVLAGLPLLQLKWMEGHDTSVYLPRNVEFFEGLKNGQLLPRWASDFNVGYGEPSFNFIPPLIFYLSALFHLLGVDFVAAEDMAAFQLLLLAGIGMYILGTEFFNRKGGLISAAAYLLAPYLQVTLYVRHALLDFSAFAFIPFVFWGLYSYARGRGQSFLIIGALALALLLLSSNPVALITFPFALLMVCGLGWMERSAMALVRGGWCLGLGLGLSAFFWLPALAEREYTHVKNVLTGYFNYHNHALYFSQIINSPWGYGSSVRGPDDEMSFAAGPLHLLLTATSIALLPVVWKRSRSTGFIVLFGLTLALAAMFMSTWASLFIWDRLPMLQYLEFPWRFLSLVAVGTSLLCGLPMLLSNNRYFSTGLTVILLAALLAINLPHATPKAFSDVDTSLTTPTGIGSKFTQHTSVGEYIPIWVARDGGDPSTPPAEPLIFLTGDGRVLAARLSPFTREFLVHASSEARLRANTYFFPGWRLYVDGSEKAIEYGRPLGLLEFPLEQGQHSVVLRFTDTPIRTLAARLSLIAFLAMVLSPWLGAAGRRAVEGWMERAQM